MEFVVGLDVGGTFTDGGGAGQTARTGRMSLQRIRQVAPDFYARYGHLAPPVSQ